MSMMVSLEFLDGVPVAILYWIRQCEDCEAGRLPRPFICTYHEGMLLGWDMCEDEMS